MKDFIKNTSLWKYAREHKWEIYDFLMHAGRKVCSYDYCGYKVSYGRGNNLIARLRKEKIFEEDLCKDVLQDLGDDHGDPILLDIGANIGLISMYMLSHNPRVSIHAFEPGKYQYDLLMKTIEENSLSNRIKLYSCALGEKNETKEFVVHADKNSSKDGFIDTGRAGEYKTVPVEVCTLDTWWKNAGKPNVSVIKIDTEGAELFIFRGAKELILEKKPIIYFEVEPANLKHYPYTAEDIFSYLKGLGYTIDQRSHDTFRAQFIS